MTNALFGGVEVNFPRSNTTEYTFIQTNTYMASTRTLEGIIWSEITTRFEA